MADELLVEGRQEIGGKIRTDNPVDRGILSAFGEGLYQLCFRSQVVIENVEVRCETSPCLVGKNYRLSDIKDGLLWGICGGHDSILFFLWEI